MNAISISVIDNAAEIGSKRTKQERPPTHRTGGRIPSEEVLGGLREGVGLLDCWDIHRFAEDVDVVADHRPIRAERHNSHVVEPHGALGVIVMFGEVGECDHLAARASAGCTIASGTCDRRRLGRYAREEATGGVGFADTAGHERQGAARRPQQKLSQKGFAET